MHVIVFSFEPVEELIRRKPGSLILLSRGVTFLRVPEGLSKLKDANFLADRTAILAEMGGDDFAASLRADHRGSQMEPHSFRSRFGALKLCTEFAGDLLGTAHDFVAKLRQEERADLEMKRLRAATPTYEVRPSPTSGDWHTFRQLCKRHKVLLVDDEHSKGWSLAFLAGLSGESVTAEDYQRFLTQRNTMVRNLCAIPDQSTVEQLVHKCTSDLVNALKLWNATSDAADHDDLELAEATDRNRNATRAEQESKKAAEEARTSLVQAETSLADARVAVQQLLNPFLEVAEECVTAPGNDSEPLLETLERSRRTLADIGRALETLAAVGARLKEARRKCEDALKNEEKAKASLIEARRLLSSSTQKQREAKGRLSSALSALASVMPFDVVLLDMRLDPVGDGNRSVSEVSGIRLLRHIREALPPIPVLMLTASEKAVSYVECVTAGASGYWIKGVSTGEEMRTLLLRAFAQRELLPVWIKMEQVKAKTLVAGKMWANNGFVPRTIPAAAPERNAINVLLEDSCRRLWEGSGSDRIAYNAVIINLGGIQEIRYQGIKDPNSNTYWFRTPKEDQELRELRNNAAHAKAARMVSRAEASKFLSYTLDQLLV